jgi:manganese transport protein
MASVAFMDPGHFATNIEAGAKYNYNLLWVVLIANVIAMLFQALSAKLGIVTGRNLAELCREQFSRPLVWVRPDLDEPTSRLVGRFTCKVRAQSPRLDPS